MNKDIFKAYDIRGIYPSELNAEDVKKIAMAYAVYLKPKKIALGRDVRLSGEELWNAAAKGLMEMGVDVIDLGVISTDMLYFAVANYGFDGGITISASHNAGEYNGMKLVREEAKPISIDTGIAEIRDLALKGEFELAKIAGKIETLDFLDDYIAKLVSFVPQNAVKPFKTVVNPNFGAAGKAIQKIADYYGLNLIKLNFEEDGNFPKGKPDPMQAESRVETKELVQETQANFGAIWDADADRCFFCDEKGEYILPIYITAFLMEHCLSGTTGEHVVIDPRSIWLPKAIAQKNEAQIDINKSGHSYIKQRMRSENAIFGAETSAHYYFRDLWFSDNGMLPFVLMIGILSQSAVPLSTLIAKYKEEFFVIEETNFTVNSVSDTIEKVSKIYADGKQDNTDGVSIEYNDWRMNLRGSNTEPLIRLNIEAKSMALAEEKLRELIDIIKK